MSTQKYAFTRVFVLMLSLAFLLNIQSCMQRLNKPKDLFEMSLEELMEVEVIIASAQSLKTDKLLIPSTRIYDAQWPAGGANMQEIDNKVDLFEMSLEELMEMEISSSALWL